MAGNGKIAWLPHPICGQINRRLENSEQGDPRHSAAGVAEDEQQGAGDGQAA
jgi:hypothetical protein